MELDELGPGRRPHLGVEVGQRLVHEEHRRPAHDGPGQGHPLALAAGELAGLAVEQAGQAQLGHHVGHEALALVGRHLP